MFRKRHRPYLGRSPKIYLPTPKPKKKFKFPWGIFKLIILASILGILVYLLFYSPYFLIQNVNVSGTKNEEIINLVQNEKGKNLWLFDKKQLEENLLKYAEISEVKITRWPLHTLKIKIIEKQEGIVWFTSGQKYLLDSQGTVIKEVTESSLPMVSDSKNAPVEIKKQIVTPSFVNFIKSLTLKFTPKTGMSLKEIIVPAETTFEIWAKTDTIYLKLDPQGDLDLQLDYFVRVYSAKKDEIKEYVDLTTWDKGMVVYK
jgi:cell division septal protein FtsQ